MRMLETGLAACRFARSATDRLRSKSAREHSWTLAKIPQEHPFFDIVPCALPLLKKL